MVYFHTAIFSHEIMHIPPIDEYLCMLDIGIHFVVCDNLPSGNGSIGSTTDGMLSALASLILREGEGSEAAWTPVSQRTASLAAFTPGFRSRATMMGETKWEDGHIAAGGGSSRTAPSGQFSPAGHRHPHFDQQGWRQGGPGGGGHQGGLLAMVGEAAGGHQPQPPLSPTRSGLATRHPTYSSG